jgi:uncharacterized OB-fold protein
MFKSCPSCGGEFVPHVSECPDCRVALVHADELAARRERELAAPGPGLEDAALLRRGTTLQLRELAEALTAAGIACGIDTDPPGAAIRGSARVSRMGSFGQDVQLALYVEARDYTAANAVADQWLAGSAPGAELAQPAGELAHCPACGEAIAEGAAACAACGLEFPEIAICASCGGGFTAGDGRCPHCGARP